MNKKDLTKIKEELEGESAQLNSRFQELSTMLQQTQARALEVNGKIELLGELLNKESE